MQIARTLWPVALTCGLIIAAGLLVFAASDPPAHAAACANTRALGTSRTLVVDPTEHQRLGSMQYSETLPVGPREVVFTFDDGPLPPHTSRILDVLATECVKATFFLVGNMARAHPHLVRRIAAEGHRIGTHSQSHPFTFHRMSLPQAQREIQGGIRSVAAALGGRLPAPFFRIPGLLRASTVERYLASQNLMTWSADIPSDDWRRIRDREIVSRTVARLEAHGGGMVLLHDIRPATALALPKLLRELKARSFRIVHVVPASRYRPMTATLPSQWRVRTASRYLPRRMRRDGGRPIARGGAWPKTPASPSASLRQRQAAGRHSARVAVVLEDNDAEAVTAFHGTRALVPGVLDLLGRFLQ